VNGYRGLLEKEVVELWRTYRLGLLAALFLVIGIATPVLTRFLPELDWLLAPPDAELGLVETGIEDVVDLLVRTLVQFGGFAMVLLAMGSVATDRARGVTALVLSRPVARGAYVLSKFVALAMAAGLATILGVLAAWLYTLWLFEPPPALPWIQLGMLVWLAVMVPGAITFLASTVLRSPLGAAAVGVAALLMLALASAAPTPNAWSPSELAALARASALEDFGIELDAARTIGVSIAMVVGSFLLAWLRFRRADV
jgi:ABC-2 type transport system permease protein